MKALHALLTAYLVMLVWPAARGTVSAQAATTGQAAPMSCIALVMPTVHGVPGNAVDVAGGVRDLMVTYLTGPSVKVVPLEAKLPSQVGPEAQQKGCEPILFVTVTHKSGGKGVMKALGQAAGSSAYYIPGGGTVGSATARAAGIVGAEAVSSMATNTKAKDEVHLEYRLQSASGHVLFGPKTETQKASVDGEDVLTPVVTRAAEAIVTRKDVK